MGCGELGCSGNKIIAIQGEYILDFCHTPQSSESTVGCLAIVSGVCVYAQTHQNVHAQYLQCFGY